MIGMCIVIDINTFSMVFDEKNANHFNFKPIKDWLERRQGIIVLGGTKYLQELKHNRSHRRIIIQLRNAGLAVRIDDNAVDQREALVKQLCTESHCNDHHLIALLAISGSSILSSLDAEAYPYIKNKQLYPKGSQRVRIYSSSRNKRLLQPCSIDEVKNAV